VNGVIIDLSDVSHELRRQYHTASRAVGRSDKARAELNAVGEKILAERMPHLAVKHAPAVRGDHANLTGQPAASIPAGFTAAKLPGVATNSFAINPAINHEFGGN
jgi:hypothetical protein